VTRLSDSGALQGLREWGGNCMYLQGLSPGGTRERWWDDKKVGSILRESQAEAGSYGRRVGAFVAVGLIRMALRRLPRHRTEPQVVSAAVVLPDDPLVAGIRHTAAVPAAAHR
jgi:hypothetical protein